jgi:hypothetical protein
VQNWLGAWPFSANSVSAQVDRAWTFSGARYELPANWWLPLQPNKALQEQHPASCVLQHTWGSASIAWRLPAWTRGSLRTAREIAKDQRCSGALAQPLCTQRAFWFKTPLDLARRV